MDRDEGHREPAEPSVQIEQPRRRRCSGKALVEDHTPDHLRRGEHEPGDDSDARATYHQIWGFIGRHLSAHLLGAT